MHIPWLKTWELYGSDGSYKTGEVGRPYLVDKVPEHTMDTPPGLGGAREFSPTPAQHRGLAWQMWYHANIDVIRKYLGL